MDENSQVIHMSKAIALRLQQNHECLYEFRPLVTVFSFVVGGRRKKERRSKRSYEKPIITRGYHDQDPTESVSWSIT